MDHDTPELDDAIDALFAEAADPDDPESAADAELPDGEDEAEAADEEPEEAAAADAADAAEPDDELSQLRQRLEAVEAERTQHAAQAQAAQRQWQAAQIEAQAAANQAAWDAEFARQEEEAWQYFGADGPSYRAAIAKIIYERDVKRQEFADYRTGRVEAAYHQSQVPAYVHYLVGDLGLGDLDRAQLLDMATTPDDDGQPIHPNAIRRFAISLKKRADLQTQERRAAKAATLKKSSGKPGGGAPHKAKPTDLDSYLDSVGF